MKRKLIAIGIAVGFVVAAMIAATIWVDLAGPGFPTPAEADAQAAAIGSYFLPSIVVGVVIAALYYWLSTPKTDRHR